MAYDVKDGYVVLFGGADPNQGGDTWIFSHGNWTNITSTLAPPVRQAASMTYDARDSYVVLFGGIHGSQFLNDTWTFAGGVWTNRTNGSAPSPRFGQSMVYDSGRHHVILFGGCSSALYGVLLCTQQAHNDTWTFSGGHWKNITGSIAPPGRKDTAMVYDPSLGGTVIFGGLGATSVLSDTWLLTGTSWLQISTRSTPPLDYGVACAFLPQLGAPVFFGGQYYGSYSNELWSFNGSWNRITTASSPHPRDDPNGMVAFGLGRDDILFGGYDGGYLNSTWRLA